MLLSDGYFDNVEELKLNQEENVLSLFVHLFHFYLVLDDLLFELKRIYLK
jgi:hypothetical protein